MIRNVKVMLLTLAAISAAGCAHSDRTVPTMGRPQWTRAQSRSAERGPVLEPPKILPETHFAAACLHEQQGMIGEAIKQYRKAIALNHNYVKAYHRLGVLLSRTGQFAEATATLRKAILLQGDDPVLYNNLGYTLMLQGKWEQARVEFDHAVALEPYFPHARINLGLTLGKLGRFDEALKNFRAVLPETDALYNLGLVYTGQRRYQRAAETFEQVLAMNPEFEAAVVQLARLAPYLPPPPTQVAAKSPGGDAKTAQTTSQQKGAPSKPSQTRVAKIKRVQKARPVRQPERMAKAGSKRQQAHQPHPTARKHGRRTDVERKSPRINRQKSTGTSKLQPARKQRIGKAPTHPKAKRRTAQAHGRRADVERKSPRINRQKSTATSKPQRARKQRIGKAPTHPKAKPRTAQAHGRRTDVERKSPRINRQKSAATSKPQPVRKQRIGKAPTHPKATPRTSPQPGRTAEVERKPQPTQKRKATVRKASQPARRKRASTTKASTVVETPKPETATQRTPTTQAPRQQDDALRHKEPVGDAFEDVEFFEPSQPSAPIHAAGTENRNKSETSPRGDKPIPLWEEEFDAYGFPCPDDAFDAPPDNPPFVETGMTSEGETIEWEAAFSELAEMLQPVRVDHATRFPSAVNRPPITLAEPTEPELAGPPTPQKLAAVRRVDTPVSPVREPVRRDKLAEIEARLAAVREELHCWRETAADLEEESYLNFSFADATTIDDVMWLIDLEELSEIASVPELIESSQRHTMASTIVPTRKTEARRTNANARARRTAETTEEQRARTTHGPPAPRAVKPKAPTPPPAKGNVKPGDDTPPQPRKYHLGRKDPPQPIEPIRAF